MSATPIDTPARRPRWGLWATAAVLAALLGLLAAGMTRDPRELPSVRIGKPWPAMVLPQLDDPAPLDPAQWRGQARIVNLWASWCSSCREEHPALMALAAELRAQGRGGQLIGLNYKDRTADAQAFLQRLGNPFSTSVVDADGRLGIELGVYGAPETYVIDARGLILYRHVGPLTPEVIRTQLLPRLKDGA
ncbi:cytochrome c biogenesis protein CcmG/thiol:disulfide interchange protein DsbE [Sphaerotilus hippei]|uniref:Cytochrome c biogenesis protein CcmG/thiol:disulfide interchange protein DsbE n=1 Tax=Sphaerotilus hippei TaxID=744406 RepID=A0A318GVT5_9BURK|nr:DsbE family thiol:disulfide interchange protein [Sphaerotilus hippei]PXW93378.1 cytochrome c biogenesis protein CcmG/thiol:disulfide interchange protein DsbE [Sphaerotilus hippei]